LFRNDGFTFMEILVAMAVLMILGLGLWLALSQGSGVLAVTSGMLRGSRQLLQLDDTLRRELAAVRIPFWTGRLPLETTSSGGERNWQLVLPFLNGDAGNRLRIALVGGEVRISRESETAEIRAGAFGPFDSVTWKTAEPAGDRPSGIYFSVKAKGSQPVTLFFTLGSHPFYLGREE
jgi:hypothetical protein